MDEQTNERMDERVDRRSDGQTDSVVNCIIKTVGVGPKGQLYAERRRRKTVGGFGEQSPPMGSRGKALGRGSGGLRLPEIEALLREKPLHF